jgi:hypothetical protein
LHLDTHEHSRCIIRDEKLRTYGRKDQFAQHLRSFHHCGVIREELFTLWKKDFKTSEQYWNCGICQECVYGWSERLKHIGTHWELGLTMLDWTLVVPQEDGAEVARFAPPSSNASITGLQDNMDTPCMVGRADAAPTVYCEVVPRESIRNARYKALGIDDDSEIWW